MQTSLKRIAEKARTQKKYRFGNLYRMLDEGMLHYCWEQLNKDAAVGVDQISYQEYGANLSENIRKLVENLKQKRYRAKLVRRKYIPKIGGKLRPLGIPATEDKLLQYAVSQILQAIFEQDFLSNMFGYRPNRSAHDAVDELQKEIRFGVVRYVVEADIKGFFDNIDQNWMVRMLEERIQDKAFIRLIQKWLKAGILETTGKVINPVTGTPQGGVCSPILANIYMHYVLNLWFEKVFKKQCEGTSYLCIYADDFVATFQYKVDAEAFYSVLGDRLGKFNLSLSPEKTNLILFNRYEKQESKSFDFLGFEFRWTISRSGKDWVRRRTSKRKLRNSLQNLKAWCRKNFQTPLRELFNTLNAKLRGYYNYYGILGNYDGLNRFYFEATEILFKSLNRRSQRQSYNWNGFQDLLREFKIEKPKIRQERQMVFQFSC